jgi:hypothetical protein
MSYYVRIFPAHRPLRSYYVRIFPAHRMTPATTSPPSSLYMDLFVSAWTAATTMTCFLFWNSQWLQFWMICSPSTVESDSLELINTGNGNNDLWSHYTASWRIASS